MFSTRADQINYARLEGIDHGELPAAIVFVVLYVPLLCLCLFYGRRLTYVYIALTLFCLVRVVGFVMRAILSASSTAGDNINLVVAQLVIYNIGFSGLLYSAHGLVVDRYTMLNSSEGKEAGWFTLAKTLLRNRMLFRAGVTAAIVLGIIGGVDQSNASNAHEAVEGNSLRKISLYIFLVIVCLLVIITIDLTFAERNAKGWNANATSLGRKHGTPILLFVCLMFITREAYLAATTGNTAKQNKAATWYPLVATPEIICVLLFMVPGLVPTKQEITESREERAGWTSPTNIPLRLRV